jgi:FKBP-type peptidyl-prolyl cis-trans isomerase
MRIMNPLALMVLMVLGSCLSEPDNSFQERLKKDTNTIDAYLAANAITGAIKDASGLRYVIGTLGTGYTPRISDQVTVTYVGKLLSGTVFDSGTLTDRELANLIAGFQLAMPQIPAGSTATLYIPSGYGYGTQSQTAIPANSILVFEIHLKSIKVAPSELAKLESDVSLIDEFLINADIENIVTDTTGLRYTITQLGDGATPGWFDRVKVSYTGYLLTNGVKGEKFYEGSNEPTKTADSRVVNYIRGFQFALLHLPKGSKATLFIPSGMAFGDQVISGGLVQVPANSNLIYDIELIEVYSPNP